MTDDEYSDILPKAHDGCPSALVDLWQKVKGYGIHWGQIWISTQQDPAYDMSDLVSMVAEAMLLAVKYWEPGRAAGEWMTIYKWELLRQIRTARQHIESAAHCVSMDSPVPDSDDLTIQDTIPDDAPQQMMALIGEADEIQELLKLLPERQRETIRRCVLNAEPMTSLAAERGVSVQAVRAEKKKALRSLQKPVSILLDDAPSFGKHKGVKAFINTGTSAVEDIAIARENKIHEAELRRKSLVNALSDNN